MEVHDIEVIHSKKLHRFVLYQRNMYIDIEPFSFNHMYCTPTLFRCTYSLQSGIFYYEQFKFIKNWSLYADVTDVRNLHGDTDG